MKNVTIIGTNYENNLFIAKKISKLLNLKLVNINEKIEESLIATYNFPLQFADKFMQEKESKIIKQAANVEGTIILVKDDEFLANENYKHFEDSLTILIEYNQKDKIKEKIQELLKSHCKISLKYENLKLKDIVTLIRG